MKKPYDLQIVGDTNRVADSICPVFSPTDNIQTSKLIASNDGQEKR